MYLAAVAQLNASSDESANWSQLETLVGRAASYGAKLIATPENTNYLGPHDEKVRRAEPLGGSTTQRLGALAKQHGVHLLIGSVNEASDEGHRCYNTTVLFDDQGELIASYRKMHLFDVDHSDDVRFLESETTKPGGDLVVAETSLGRIGLSICYDLRFPTMYRRLVEAGAQILAVPAAFTMTTGKDHWHPLLRARAIETQCYVLAPGQHGHHDDKGLRHSYGHSMIVDPWGHIIAMASDGTALALAEIDLDRVEGTRRGMPVSSHRRF